MARVTEPTSGRVMEVWSTEPGLQFYTGNFLDGTITGKGGWVYQHRSAFCMEPQHYPGFPEPAAIPHHGIEAGRTLPQHHHLPLLRATLTLQTSAIQSYG